MGLRATLLAVSLLVAAEAIGATPLDAARASARAAREQVTQLRSRQLERRNELSALSGRIEALKAQPKGRLLPGGELDAALKSSQELSGVLTELAQQVAAREAALESANLALLEALSAELTRLRADFDRQTSREVRRGLIGQLRRLRGERDALRATLPQAKLPTLDTVRPSDDPEELLEQADLLRDNQEKLERELKAMDARIAERREEAELDRRVQRFMGEESMFDDQDRRLRVQRTEVLSSAAPATPATRGDDASPPAAAGFSAGPTPAGPFESEGSPGGPLALGQGAPAGLGATIVTSGSDARPQVGAGTAVARSAAGDEDLELLEAQRARIKGLTEELKKKAGELEQRASELR
jgi:hypothetical protein